MCCAAGAVAAAGAALVEPMAAAVSPSVAGAAAEAAVTVAAAAEAAAAAAAVADEIRDDVVPNRQPPFGPTPLTWNPFPWLAIPICSMMRSKREKMQTRDRQCSSYQNYCYCHLWVITVVPESIWGDMGKCCKYI